MRELLVATSNEGKLKEVLSELEGIPFKILTFKDVQAGEDVEEHGAMLEENAVMKAKKYATRTGKLTLADDTGLFVDALDGRPGVHSARYCEGSMQRGIRKLLSELQGVPDEKRTARFRTVIAVYDPEDSKMKTCEGSVRGRIVQKPRGEQGFGYDPIFDYESKGKTGGELTLEKKRSLGHRFKAAAKAREILLAEFS